MSLDITSRRWENNFQNSENPVKISQNRLKNLHNFPHQNPDPSLRAKNFLHNQANNKNHSHKKTHARLNDCNTIFIIFILFFSPALKILFIFHFSEYKKKSPQKISNKITFRFSYPVTQWEWLQFFWMFFFKWEMRGLLISLKNSLTSHNSIFLENYLFIVFNVSHGNKIINYSGFKKGHETILNICNFLPSFDLTIPIIKIYDFLPNNFYSNLISILWPQTSKREKTWNFYGTETEGIVNFF